MYNACIWRGNRSDSFAQKRTADMSENVDRGREHSPHFPTLPQDHINEKGGGGMKKKVGASLVVEG